MKRLFLLFLVLSATTAFAQQDQTPRAPAKDKLGLLQINKDLYELAATTGGDFYFWAEGEFASSKLKVPIHEQPVILAYGSLEDTKRVFEIPIESDVRIMTIFAGIQRKDLAVLLRPDGTPMRDGVQLFQHMLVAMVPAPQTGTWKLELQGSGTFAVTAAVNGSGLQLIPSERIAVAKDGSIIIGSPTVPYRMMTTGKDEKGAAYQRIERQLHKPPAFLALGDSYTIGESVAEGDRWPNQLSRVLGTATPQIIAKTGWTTGELNAAIDVANPSGPHDLVTLLIGVNNQFRGRDAEEYRREFAALAKRAIGFASGNASHVIVVSIPDWGVTPFAAKRDKTKIARAIDRFNTINREESALAGVHYVDITAVSRSRAKLIAADGLHPSAEMYAEWVKLIAPVAKQALGLTR